MSPLTEPRLESLAQIYAPFREKMEEYRRIAERDLRKAEPIFAELQVIYKAWRAGHEHANGKFKAELIELTEEGALGEFTMRRVLKNLWAVDA